MASMTGFALVASTTTSRFVERAVIDLISRDRRRSLNICTTRECVFAQGFVTGTMGPLTSE
jgi:hypothetical protein